MQLCELELIEREKRSAARRLKDAKFPSIKTLENFDFQAQPSINKPLVSELMRCAYIEGRETIILIGNPGTGKTHLATALGVEACGRGKRVRICQITELLFEVISNAYERTSLIVTTNLPFEQWTEVLGSERLVGATLDRLTHRCHILETGNDSFRFKASTEAVARKKKEAAMT